MVKALSFRLNSVSTHFLSCLLKRPVKHNFLDIDLTTFLGAGNSGNTSVMRLISFSNLIRFEKSKKN